MKRNVFVLVLCTVLACTAIADSAYQKWSRRIQEPTAKDYDTLISEMQRGVTDLKAEKKIIDDQDDKGEFVSVWAIKEADRQLSAEFLTRSGGLYYSTAGYYTTGQLIARAKKLDAEKNAEWNHWRMSKWTTTIVLD